MVAVLSEIAVDSGKIVVDDFSYLNSCWGYQYQLAVAYVYELPSRVL